MSDSVSEFKAHIRAAVDRALTDTLAQLREAEESRTWRDVVRCVVGRHKPAITAEHGTLQRCSCGAIRFVPGGRWVEGDPFGRRRRAGRKALGRAMKQIEEAT